ncbi:MAG: molybdopterin-dependent oxidoreductase [Betaproteobacteria bacterium]|nr:molybdopterin-dependent oxidoreductase [Betaproteobacteria bacterium]
MKSRRSFLKSTGSGLAIAGASLFAPKFLYAAGLSSGTIEASSLETLPGKKPLIKRNYRPVNYETPVEYFDDVITPNDRFFVRWHLTEVPEITPADWRLKIGGESAEHPFELSLEQLKKDFPAVEMTAVCQCSGNRRGLSDPHVAGVEWGYGAMGNARWKGVRLKDVLAKAGIKPDAVEITFDGADGPAIDKTPDFAKSLPLWKALDENVLIAYEMNGEPLPHLNGGPARIIVPGWTATYWVKKIVAINAVAKPLQTFWMNPAYRVPKGMFPTGERFTSQEKENVPTTPITEIVVNSLITNIKDGQRFHRGAPVVVKGLAWDAGYGINLVEVSIDEGKTWQAATLGADQGRFSFRSWQFSFKPTQSGKHVVMAKASNRQGATQTFELIFNPAGYHNNVVQRIAIQVA